jgi:hypothetical protein
MICEMMGHDMSSPYCCIRPRSDWGQSFKQALVLMSRGGASASGRHEAPVQFLEEYQAQARVAQLPVRACIGQSSNSQNHQEQPLHGTCSVCRAAPATMLVVACGHIMIVRALRRASQAPKPQVSSVPSSFT